MEFYTAKGIREVYFKNGWKPSVERIRRWIYSGEDGIFLESIKIGKRRLVSIEAMDRFFSQRIDTLPVSEDIQRRHAAALEVLRRPR